MYISREVLKGEYTIYFKTLLHYKDQKINIFEKNEHFLDKIRIIFDYILYSKSDV